MEVFFCMRVGVDEELHYVSDRRVYVLFVFVSSLVVTFEEERQSSSVRSLLSLSPTVYNPLNQPFNSSIHKKYNNVFLLLPFLSLLNDFFHAGLATLLQ